MDDYRLALKAYLEPADRSQQALADAVPTTQPTIHRYVTGERFPDSEMARKIDAATEGEVPFSTWQRVAMARLGIETSDAEAA